VLKLTKKDTEYLKKIKRVAIPPESKIVGQSFSVNKANEYTDIALIVQNPNGDLQPIKITN